MRSVSPCVLKHHIPLSFSYEALDRPSTVAPSRRPFLPPDSNPLTNIKLRTLEEEQAQPRFVLTFSNLTNKDYRPRQALEYAALARELQKGQSRVGAMRQVLNKMGTEGGTAERRKFLHSHTHTASATVHRPASQSNMAVRSQSGTRRGSSTANIYGSERCLPRNIHSCSSSHLRTLTTSRTIRPKPTAPVGGGLRMQGNRAPNGELSDSPNRLAKLELVLELP